ncbi:LCP family protein [Sporosarcina sp. G11-34]|uniref:LCP family protein n=1 Tax=Sporosarcina sp. G11-34 TaxID=2849605 RepID=UPI0022A9CA4C|nr:LCP family protein [Sporosarcina sp. G11-34]MCZ2258224.1 LCP family protein [Sporosarcina sp. G11-34]
MDENYEEPILKRKKKRKLRLGRVILTCSMLVFIAAGLYSFVQYNAGKAIGKGNAIDPGSFKGDAIHPKYATIENYLLLGVDDDGSGKSRTDTMMVLSWNKSTGTMNVISFMRDIYAEIPGYKSYKLNTAYYLAGVQTVKDTITGMFGIPIHHYAIVDFENFESIVDIAFPKGVEIDVKKEMSEKIGVTLTPGKKKLNGKELLGYARFRADREGDFGRVTRQQEVISAMKDEALQPGMIMAAPKLAGAVSSFVQTDLSSKDEISRAISLVLKRGAKVETMTVPVEGTYSFNSYSHAGSVIEVDIEKNKEEISNFLEIPLE